MKFVYHIFFGLLLTSCITDSAQKETGSTKTNVSIAEQKKRDEDAQKYRNMVEALGGKHLEHKPNQPAPDNKAKL